MNKLKIEAQSEPIMIELPGLQAVVIDPARGIIAVDGISGSSAEFEHIEWRVLELRDGTYGDFHRLTPAAQCIDADCVERGEHVLEPAPAAAPLA